MATLPDGTLMLLTWLLGLLGSRRQPRGLHAVDMDAVNLDLRGSAGDTLPSNVRQGVTETRATPFWIHVDHPIYSDPFRSIPIMRLQLPDK